MTQRQAETIARVALDTPLDTLFDYAAGSLACQPGDRVAVPFGRRRMAGIVMETAARSELPPERLRPLDRVFTETPRLPDDVLRLLRFAADYYQYPLGAAVMAALPGLLRQPRPLSPQPPVAWRLTAAAPSPEALPARAVAQRRLLEALHAQARLDASAAAALTREAPRLLRQWRENGWVEPVSEHGEEAPGMVADAAPALNADQAAAVEAVAAALGRYAAFLLHGVTGSGKTEVYLRLAGQVLARGGQALVLVPEIALTPQLEARFAARLGAGAVVTLHSGVAAGDRAQRWLRAVRGDAAVVLGTRLALFTPLPRLALVVVDEEHDASFKQEEGLRYSGRDLAVWRARDRGVPVLLGSATPSAESWHNACGGRYRLLSLGQRAVPGSALPAVELVDVQQHKPVEGFSAPLLEGLRATLARGEQVLVFINRRGYAPVLWCASCGWMSPCPRCASRLVVHLAARRMRCHHCGHEEAIPAHCPGCGSPDLAPVGHGTQRVEATLTAHFPQARILRIDRDSTRRRDAWQRLLARIHGGEADILVGTQLLAKGHDFPALSLVAVLDADSALYSPDFRAAERLFALLMQVAGRAGRAGTPGRVLVQTRFPGHFLYQALVRHDFPAFAEAILAERRQSGFPPFMHQALLRAAAHDADRALRFLAAARSHAEPLAQGVTLFDPVPAAMPRVAGLARAQLLVQSASRQRLQPFLRAWRGGLDALAGRNVRWALDVDPLEV